jgi:hypothetical protein
VFIIVMQLLKKKNSVHVGSKIPLNQRVIIEKAIGNGDYLLGYESIPIPDHDKWTVTLWHFGTDSQDYKEPVEDKYSVTLQIGQNVLGRIYNKRKHRKRSEIQERPNKPSKDALKEKSEGRGF